MSRKSVLIVLIVLGVASIVACYRYRTAKAVNWIEGRIASDTTWTPVDTYRVVNDTHVDLGVTLTIQPGVEVQFADGFSLVIEGSLNAMGVESNPIIFTSSRVAKDLPDPYPGVWNTIKFKGNSSEQFFLKHAKVKYAVHGVTVESLGLATIEKSELIDCSGNGIMLIGKSNVVINENTIEKNRNGIATDDANTHAGLIVINNEISNNRRMGVYLYSYSENGDGYIYNVTFSSNVVSSNGGTGIYVNAERHHAQSVFDLSMLDNIISANYQKGVWIEVSVTSFTRNSIAYNLYGVVYTATHNNMVNYNDIYHNSYGMSITGSTVNAEHNYWGHSSGPHHESLNPEGEGNPVNGDGTNLDFIPFNKTSFGPTNERPVAMLEVDKTDLNANETVTFDAASSTDDGRIDYYFFDFGDGTNSSWTTLSVVTHNYSEGGDYNATLIVMDNFGVTSLDGDLAYAEITVARELEFPSFLILSIFMTLLIIVMVILLYKRRKHSMMSNGSEVKPTIQ